MTLYVREAHPGRGRRKDVQQPVTYAERLKLARQTSQELSATTLFLVDGMDNAVADSYGGLPNSAYVIGQDGCVSHKQSWMDSQTLRPALEALFERDGVAGTSVPKFGAKQPIK